MRGRWLLPLVGVILIVIQIQFRVLGPIVGYGGAAFLFALYFLGMFIGVIAIIGGFLGAIGMFVLRGGFQMQDKYVYLVCVGLVIFGFVAIVLNREEWDYYCDACGQYLGNQPRSCPRCGHNVYTRQRMN